MVRIGGLGGEHGAGDVSGTGKFCKGVPQGEADGGRSHGGALMDLLGGAWWPTDEGGFVTDGVPSVAMRM